MRKRTWHQTKVGSIRVNNMSGGASINFGPSIHKGLQANVKLNAADVIAGDEFVFGCPEEEEENENENNNNNNEEGDDNDNSKFINTQFLC